MKSEQPYIFIRNAKADEMMTFIDLATKEGWDQSPYDAQYYFKADPHGFFVGETDGRIVATVSAVSYSKQIAHLSFWIVQAKYRRKGYGRQMLAHAIKYLHDANIGTDCEMNLVPFFKEFNFMPYFKTYTMTGSSLDHGPEDPHLVLMKDVPFQKILQYEKHVCPIERPALLTQYFKMPESHAMVYYESDKVRGYGFMKKQGSNYRIGPLYADNEEIAEKLINSLRGFPKNRTHILVNPQQCNQKSIQLYKKLGMKITNEWMRMYTKQLPKIEYNKIYGILSRDIG